MKCSALLLNFLFAGLLVNAQADPAISQTVTKGYYSIGPNFSKLERSPAVRVDSLAIPDTRKGYYSTRHHNKKFSKQALWFLRQNSPQKVTKGYYSIGNNAEK
jgi:hypothetical protein